MNNWNYLQAQRWAADFLKSKGKDPYAPEFLLKMLHNWDTTTLLLHHRDLMPADEQSRFTRAIHRVAEDEPVQYIVGKAPFFKRTFVISPDVLIPEPETEDLVEWVLNEMPSDQPLNVLDLGTGSGVIGITLALERPNWQVTLSDISAGALRVAQANQRLHGTNLPVVESDLFSTLSDQRFDLIVTNPPYVSTSAIAQMDQSVLKYEPPLALFTSENGLGFYHRLFAEAARHLTQGGQLFGETGYDQEESIQELLKRLNPHSKIETRHDEADKMRMVRAWDFR